MEDHRDLWWPSPTVELGKVLQLPLPEPFTTVLGGHLSAIQVSYESWGELNAARDNTVLVVHPLTADCHVTGEFAGQPQGWWEALVGPGRAVDTERDYVVCPNLIGGCYGTTGPRFPGRGGDPYYYDFPLVTPLDMMRVQRRFLQALGIERLRMVIGPSMGGMIAWEWAIEASEAVDTVVIVAAPLRASPHQIGLNWLQRRGIELDITENEVVARVGQMLARGVGMLSYRSSVGLEEKFGRGWFKEPGSTLADRGMFNVESWLRHHGRRIAKRFDPYTYLLYSRAMDLHDVSNGRGDLVTALNRVICRTTIMGISSDNLYPAGEVRLGADMLDRLGKDVRYGEIRSPNGHDAFLLDTDQIAAILHGVGTSMPAPGLAAPRRGPRSVRIGILGAGQVAASFVQLLRDRSEQLATRHNLAPEVLVVGEIDRDKVLDPAFESLDVTHDPAALAERGELDVLVDLTRGLGTLPLVRRTLERARPVVTSNKVLLQAHGGSLEQIAFDHGVRLAYHDSIAAGWPLIHVLERPLSHGGVTEILAMLSTTCNVVLECMEDGASYDEAVARAVALDITEPDPQLDLSGWDTLQKLLLLVTRVTGRRYAGRNVVTAGMESLDPELVRNAPPQGLRIKYVALAADITGSPSATVRPVAVRADSHLGLVRGSNNIVITHAQDGSEMVHLGPGGGALPVATAVLNDLVGLFDPMHSWTGRFPLSEEAFPLPRVRRWLALDRGRLSVVEWRHKNAVPILD